MRTNKGAFQLSRSIYDSEIWMKPADWLKVWIYLLGNVNFEDNNLFKRGENLFNYQVIAIECGVTYNVVNKCINFLKSAKQVSTRKTTRGVVLEINNYDKYQDLSNYRQNESKTEAKQKQNESYTITEQGNNETMKQGKEDISKDIGEQALVVSKGNEDINNLLEIIKGQVEFLGFIYKKGKYERQRAKNILTGKDFGAICEKANMSRIEFCKSIIYTSTLLDFWRGKINNAETLYEHYAKVYNDAVNKKAKLENTPPKREIF